MFFDGIFNVSGFSRRRANNSYGCGCERNVNKANLKKTASAHQKWHGMVHTCELQQQATNQSIRIHLAKPFFFIYRSVHRAKQKWNVSDSVECNGSQRIFVTPKNLAFPFSSLVPFFIFYFLNGPELFEKGRKKLVGKNNRTEGRWKFGRWDRKSDERYILIAKIRSRCPTLFSHGRSWLIDYMQSSKNFNIVFAKMVAGEFRSGLAECSLLRRRPWVNLYQGRGGIISHHGSWTWTLICDTSMAGTLRKNETFWKR